VGPFGGPLCGRRFVVTAIVRRLVRVSCGGGSGRRGTRSGRLALDMRNERSLCGNAISLKLHKRRINER
jgi:hypothetical protein